MSEPTSSSSKIMMADPDYISYLLDPKQTYQCYFIVGNPELNIPVERVGVVTKMLAAHSMVLRLELQDSKLAEKGDIKVTDLAPDTFKNMLRYTYGYDNTVTLTFDEADNLLYAAEKYMLNKLKNELATRLMDMLNYENICSLMNNPACYRQLELNSTIKKILQFETDRVLASPNFLHLSSNAFEKILEQYTLNVPEIEIWRAAIKWAKHRVGSNEGAKMRSELTSHLQYVRVCSLSTEDICNDVIPTEVLSYSEVKMVCQAIKSKEIQPDLTTVCNVIEDRLWTYLKSDVIKINLADPTEQKYVVLEPETIFILETSDYGIVLCSMEVDVYGMNNHRCHGDITFIKDTQITDTIKFVVEKVHNDKIIRFPLRKSNEKAVLLFANSVYLMNIRFLCSSMHMCCSRKPFLDKKGEKHVKLSQFSSSHVMPLTSISYRIFLH